MAFIQLLPRRKPASQINNYIHFYEFGDSGGTLIEDSGPGAQDLVNTTSPASVQVTDAVQGEVAQFATGAGFTNMGWPTGNVDKSITALINTDDVTVIGLFFSETLGHSIDLNNANRMSVTNLTDSLLFPTIDTMVVDTWFWFGMSVTSDFKYRMYLNGAESTAGELQGTVTVELDQFSDIGFFNFFTGFGGKVRIYDQVLSSGDFLSVFNRDFKVA